MAEDVGLSDKLKALRIRFADGLAGRVDEVRDATRSVMAARGEDAFLAARRDLLFPLHKLSGSSAPMGHPILGVHAKELENFLQDLGSARDGLTADEADIITDMVEEIAVSAGRPATLDDDDDLPGSVPNDGGEMAQLALMLVADKDAGDDLAQQLGNFGYVLTVFSDPDAFEQAVKHVRPAALVLDVDLPEGVERGLLALDAVASFRPNVPIIAVTVKSDIDTRLRLVRAGVSAVLAPPLDTHELVQALDRLTAPNDASPLRIMIVEDDHDMAYFYELLLQGKGMKTLSVIDPMTVLDYLVTFDPDLILMDVNMPGCSGIELAEVIRQHRSHLQIPIVFLTADTSASSHLYAVRAGGDDYLTKPVDKRLLEASVRARAERARQLTSLISSDSMTGLLNHSSIMESLSTELSRARRHNQPLSFAMIDIDHFKAVNDTYGHWVGDTVIKAIAQVLRQRLRKTDVIGRYGGEEFAVILSDVDAHTAARLIDRIRDGFTKIRHSGGDEEFFVTFSCGIATYPQIDDPATLTTTADEALYEAKQQGRNRVIISETCR